MSGDNYSLAKFQACSMKNGSVIINNKSYLSGGIQYYTFKPIKIGEELLVFYGDEYFQDLGFNLDPDEDTG